MVLTVRASAKSSPNKKSVTTTTTLKMTNNIFGSDVIVNVGVDLKGEGDDGVYTVHDCNDIQPRHNRTDDS